MAYMSRGIDSRGMLVPGRHRSDEEIIETAMLDSFRSELAEEVVVTKTVIGTVTPGEHLSRLRHRQRVTDAGRDLRYGVGFVEILNLQGCKLLLRVAMSQLAMGVTSPGEDLPRSRDG